MQNFNDYNKEQQAQQAQQVKPMQALDQIPNWEGIVEYKPSKFSQFVGIAWILIIILFFAILGYMIMRDDAKTKKQIQANVDAVMNTPKMQEYRAKEARRQREIARQRRLRQLGVDGVTQNAEKDDLLNQQLKRQEIAEEKEKLESQKPQDVDYRAQLAAYNARLKEVRAEEAHLRAEAEAIARAEAEAREQAEREQAKLLREGQPQYEDEEKARIEQEKAEQERAARIKIAQEKAAYAAKLKAQLEARKTQKNTLQTSNSSRNDRSFPIRKN